MSEEYDAKRLDGEAQDSSSELMSDMGLGGNTPERELKPGDHAIQNEPKLPPEVLEMTSTRSRRPSSPNSHSEPESGVAQPSHSEEPYVSTRREEFDIEELQQSTGHNSGVPAEPRSWDLSTTEPPHENADVSAMDAFGFDAQEIPEEVHGNAADYPAETYKAYTSAQPVESAEVHEPEPSQMDAHTFTPPHAEYESAAGDPEKFEDISAEHEQVTETPPPFEVGQAEAENLTDEASQVEESTDEFESPPEEVAVIEHSAAEVNMDSISVEPPPCEEPAEFISESTEELSASSAEGPAADSEGDEFIDLEAPPILDATEHHEEQESLHSYIPQDQAPPTRLQIESEIEATTPNEDKLPLAFRDDPNAPPQNIHKPATVDRRLVDERANEDKFSVFDELEPSKQIAAGDGARDLTDVHIDELLAQAAERKASDVHITVGLPPMARVDGYLQPLSYKVLDPQTARRLVYDVLDNDNLQKFEQSHELDFGYGVKGLGRYRVNVYMQRHSVAAALRSIPNAIPSFEDLGLPNTIRDLNKRSSGLVLVTGPTGSGKSTTIASMIDDINEHSNAHIMTIEDPIEYLHSHKKCMVNQREMHYDTFSFHSALRAVLREDPDIILVGELRDLETIEAALTLAETGHLVFGTLHTRNAPSTIDRIIDVFPSDQQEQIRVLLGNTLEGVVSQQLLPRLGGGRSPALEIMMGNSPIRNLIREGKTHQMYSVIETSGKLGMVTMDRSLANLYQGGQVSYEECLLRAVDKETFARLAQRAA